MRLWKKLCSRRGETLTETLVAVLVVGLSSAVLAAMIGAASRLNAVAIQKDETLYAAVIAAETGQDAAAETGKVQVTVGSDTVTFGSVSYYTDKDEENQAIGTLYSYSYSKSGGGS